MYTYGSGPKYHTGTFDLRQPRFFGRAVLKNSSQEHIASFKLQEQMQQPRFEARRQSWHLQGSSLHINQSRAATNNTGRFTTHNVSEEVPGNLDVLRPEASGAALPEQRVLLQHHTATSALGASQRPSGLLVAWRI